uniref:glutaminase n=1 Tax=Acrobeloides nanus TaxID=290746 RepID=A0A914E4N4_9BILA
METRPTIGILALQGNFYQHAALLQSIGTNPVLVKTASDLTSDMEGLVLPGGESTTMVKLLKADKGGLWETILEFGRNGKPILGTCAGLVLMARALEPENDMVKTMGFLNIVVQRNAYGPQINSQFNDIKTISDQTFSVSFIRAPAITQLGKGVEVLAEFD